MTFLTLLNPKNYAIKTGGGISRTKAGGVENTPILIQKTGGAITLPEVALTITGNPITDADRWLKSQGDALPLGSGYGIWESSINYNKNSGAETSITAGGWLGYGAGSIATRDLGNFKFGTASFKTVFNGDASNTMGYTNQGNFNFVSSLPVATVGDKWTISAYFKATPGFDAKLIRILCRMRGGANALADTVTTVTLTSSGFVRWSATGTVDFADRTGIDIFFIQSSAPILGEGFFVDGIQLEQKAYVTPVIHTDGTTAARNSARLSSDTVVPSTAKIFFAARVICGFSSSSTISFNTITYLGNADVSEGLQFFYRQQSNAWVMRASSGGSSVGDATIAQTVVPGTVATVIGYWDGTQVAISVNGSVFTKVTTSAVPNPASILFQIGQLTGGSYFNGNIEWLMYGTMPTTLTNADAATINGYGNAVPAIRTLPASWSVQGIWRANTNLVEYLPQGRAAKSVTASKSAGAISPSIAGTTKFVTARKVGGGIIIDSTGGVENHFLRVAKHGGARTELWSGVTSYRKLYVKTGGIVKRFIGGGTYRALKLKVGGGISTGHPGGTYRKLGVHTGGGISSAHTGATRTTAWKKAGGGLSTGKTGATRRLLFIKTAGGKSNLVEGATRYSLIIRIGGGKSAGHPGGTKTFHFQHQKNGGAFSALSSGTTKKLTVLKIGGGVVTSKGGGWPIFKPDFNYDWLLGVGLSTATLLDAAERTPTLVNAQENVGEIMTGNMETPVLKKVRVR